MDPRSQNKKAIQIVNQYIKKYESKIKCVMGEDPTITHAIHSLRYKLDHFNQEDPSHEEWVSVWKDIEIIKEAVIQQRPLNLDEENKARQKRYQEDLAKTLSKRETTCAYPHAQDELYRPLSNEEYEKLHPERIKARKKIETLIHSDEHRGLSFAQLSINEFVNANYPSAYFIKKFACILNAINTHRLQEKQKLWQTILFIYQQRKNEQLKILEMKQSIINEYFAIRKSKDGSQGIFFGKGSRLADELEKFIKKEIGINVPHRVSSDEAPLQLSNYLDGPEN